MLCDEALIQPTSVTSSAARDLGNGGLVGVMIDALYSRLQFSPPFRIETPRDINEPGYCIPEHS
jgi:hypothetical protein